MLSTDKRWKQLGDVLVNYCLEVKPGQKVIIAQNEIETWPLALATYESTIKAGGYPQIQMKSEYLRRAFMKYGTEEQYSWAPELEILSTEWADCYMALRGGYNLDLFHDIPADVLAKNQQAHGKVSTARWKNTRWSLTRVPNEAFAQQAGLDLETVMDMYFDACLLDYSTALTEWGRWAAKLENSSEVHLTGKNTDLKMSIKGRPWGVPSARGNMPGAETDNAPLEDTVNGHIWFENPGVLGGRLMHDLYLEWKDGKLVKATSSSNEDYLHKILVTDAGASKVGEFAIGLNDKLTKFTNDILWDEKMYGTVHIAMGRAYERRGGTNQSAIHWDIIKDLRQEGDLMVDGKTILKEGKLLFDEI
ncbi:MAG: aminopeptidase [Pelolinea sp.]|nr:aminopeptidase [Pelolinea sp.]